MDAEIALMRLPAFGRFLPVATGCFVAGCGWSFFSRAELCPVRHQCPAQLTNKSLAYLYFKGRVDFKLIRGRDLSSRFVLQPLGNRVVKEFFYAKHLL